MNCIRNSKVLMAMGMTGAGVAFTGGASMADDIRNLPNIIYILTDDMGYGDVSALNPESQIKTPHIDRLAAEGMIFTDAHSSSSVCTPSRYGILTGRYCWRTRLKRAVLWNYDNSLMTPSRLNVASYLKKQGYNTGMVGKWHLGLDWSSKSKPGQITNKEDDVDFSKPFRNGPVDMGFDSFFGINASLDMPPYVFLENDKAVTIPTAKAKGFGRGGLADKDLRPEDFLPAFTDKAVSYIREQEQDRPFFLYLSLNAPHTPIAPSKPFQGKSKLDGRLGNYADFCMEVDDTVGQVLAALDEKGLSENTLVVFTADNGCAYYIGVKQFEEQGHFPSYIYRGYKGGTFDGGHRIPFLARWPQTIKPQTTNDQTICLTDLLATCADIAGTLLPANAGEDSLSFLPALRGNAIDTSRRQAVVHHDFKGIFAIRKGKWKLLVQATAGIQHPYQPDGTPHLYDLENDPGETNNLANKKPATVKALLALLETYKLEGRSVQRRAK